MDKEAVLAGVRKALLFAPISMKQHVRLYTSNAEPHLATMQTAWWQSKCVFAPDQHGSHLRRTPTVIGLPGILSVPSGSDVARRLSVPGE